MQLSLVAAFIQIAHIFWCGASAQDCNYTSFLLNLGYSKECIHSSQSSLISCSNDEAPPYKECCSAQENITTTLTEARTLLQEEKAEQENITTTLTEVKTLLQEEKAEQENITTTLTEVKTLLQEEKADQENIATTLTEVKTLLQEGKAEQENMITTLTGVKTLLQEEKAEQENITTTLTEVKTLLQEGKTGQENITTTLTEVKREQEKFTTTLTEVKTLLQEGKAEQENITTTLTEVKMENERKNSDNTLWERLEHISNSLSDVKTILQDFLIPATTTTTPKEIYNVKDLQKSCAELRLLGETSSGVRTVKPYGSLNPKQTTVYCDQGTDGGGWTVIQSRSPLPVRESFEKPWQDYVAGFGDRNGEYWLGLESIHALTNSAQMELRVDLMDWGGQRRWALYKVFHVGNAASKYVLRIGAFSGDAGDGIAYYYESKWYLNGNQFSTYDNDNDNDSGRNCAELYRGGWWFNKCYAAYLNGLPYLGKTPNDGGIHWKPFREWDQLKETSMKIRPVSFKS